MNVKDNTKLKSYKTISFAFLSGIAGLSYEVLYARFFSIYFGDVYSVVALILFVTFLGLATGYWYAQKIIQWLWIIEGLLGILAFFCAVILSQYGLQVTTLLPDNFSIRLLFLALLTFLPFFLTGISVPAFSFLLKQTHSGQFPFQNVYAIYNLGAAIAVLSIEFFLLREFGISAALVMAGSINIVVSLGILKQTRGFSFAQSISEATPHIPYLTIFITGIASTIFQLLYLEIAWHIFGAVPEVFALVLATALLGVVLGSYIAKFFSLTFPSLLLIGVILIPSVFLLTKPIIFWWAWGANTENAFVFFTFRNLLLIGFGLPISTFFGATIPIAIRYLKISQYGQALGIGSLGNAVGAVLMLLLLRDLFSSFTLIIILTACIYTTALLVSKKHISLAYKISTVGIGAIILLLGVWLWYPHQIIYSGYAAFRDPENLKYELAEQKGVQLFKEKGNVVALVDHKDGFHSIVHSGYRSLSRIEDSRTQNRENILPEVANLYTSQNEHALVFGLGTGTTVNATANRYKKVTVFEINPAMLEVTDELKTINNAVLYNKNVSIHIEDGIVAITRDQSRYDTIINTVSSPLYYSANKLYTKEFFKLVKKHLDYGGVYIGWVDERLQAKGTSILVDTLLDVFPSCSYFFLNIGYFLYACGNNLTLAEDKKNMEKNLLGKAINQLRFSISSSTLRTFNPHNIRNTIDTPVLSFEPPPPPPPSPEMWYPNDFSKLYPPHLQIDSIENNCCKDNTNDSFCKAVNMFHEIYCPPKSEK